MGSGRDPRRRGGRLASRGARRGRGAAADGAGDLRGTARRPSAAGARRGEARRVAGRRFPREALALFEVEEPDAALDTLVRRSLVSASEEDVLLGPSHSYRHALLRDTGYASLARAERARLHVRLADWLAEQARAVATGARRGRSPGTTQPRSRLLPRLRERSEASSAASCRRERPSGSRRRRALPSASPPGRAPAISPPAHSNSVRRKGSDGPGVSICSARRRRAPSASTRRCHCSRSPSTSTAPPGRMPRERASSTPLARSAVCCVRRRSSPSRSSSPTGSCSSSASARTWRRRSCFAPRDCGPQCVGRLRPCPRRRGARPHSRAGRRRPGRRARGAAAPDQLHGGGRRAGATAVGRDRVARARPRPLGARRRRSASTGLSLHRRA